MCQATLKKLTKYIADPMMAIENVSKVSKAASSLCMWVHAMDVYSKVAKEVRAAMRCIGLCCLTEWHFRMCFMELTL